MANCTRCNGELVLVFKGHDNGRQYINALNVIKLNMTVSPGYAEFIDDDSYLETVSYGEEPENNAVFCHGCAVLLLSFFSEDMKRGFVGGHQKDSDCSPDCEYGVS